MNDNSVVNEVNSKETVPAVVSKENESSAANLSAEVNPVQLALENESLRLELKKLNEKLASMEMKFEALRSFIPISQNDSPTDRNGSGMQRNDSQIKQDGSQLKLDDSRLKDDDSCIKENDSRLKRGDSRLKADDSHLKDDDSHLKAGESRLKDDDSCLKAGESCLKADDSCLKVDDSCLKVDDSQMPGIDKTMLQNMENGDGKASGESAMQEDFMEARRQRLEDFERQWYSASREVRWKKGYNKKFLELYKIDPSFYFPGTVSIKKDVDRYGIKMVETAYSLQEVMASKLNRKWPGVSPAVKAIKVLKLLSELKISKREELLEKSGLRKASFERAFGILKSLGYAKSLFGGRVHSYIITEAGQKFLAGEGK